MELNLRDPRRALFQVAVWYRKLLCRTTGLWLGRPTGRVNKSLMFRLQIVVRRKADRVLHVALFERFVKLRLGKLHEVIAV